MPEALASQAQKQQLSDKKLLLKLAKKYVADKKTLYILGDAPTLNQRLQRRHLSPLTDIKIFLPFGNASRTRYSKMFLSLGIL
ncbi:MAG: hypothetical protein EAZ90_06655 [Oscillatoriales cyanobacterium]|nr:MAG: hypothetical protein EAZ94_18980 [Oscillatoriales cyanobacterium]TAE22071.1 MAG: hypothetical protein EAZ93_19005 [Oscillatoriales cyanobacterium]TAE44412.1 MAG: hypothetical protein EAZ90_06655 [Oscillatoriales cyanobacterium]TAE55434.1 MAG: hypothetical protein EAZ88_06605 [Oscillatoriales cyanobacterium]TAG02836.1 MAG: hypothetical protein EAZ45_10955 [Oscillatoriales cyanobacterium]